MTDSLSAQAIAPALAVEPISHPQCQACGSIAMWALTHTSKRRALLCDKCLNRYGAAVGAHPTTFRDEEGLGRWERCKMMSGRGDSGLGEEAG